MRLLLDCGCGNSFGIASAIIFGIIVLIACIAILTQSD